MTRVSPRLNLRPLLALAGTAALATALAWQHAPSDRGLGADELEGEQIAPPAAATEWLTGALLVDLVEPEDGEGGSPAELSELVSDLDERPELTAGLAGFYAEGEHLVRVTGERDELQAVARKLADDPLVEGVEWELRYRLPEGAVAAEARGPAPSPTRPGDDRVVPDDPMFGLQWHMEQIRAPEAWALTRGEGAVVAVIDTGVAYKDGPGVRGVPDLAGTKIQPGKTFVAGAPDGLDDHAHGTHVAGTIAQTTNNGIGVTGVAYDATILPLKVLSARGSGSVAAIANAIRYAADEGAHVINMSLGGPFPSKVLAKAVAYAHDRGVTVVCASGNDHRGRVGYPAANEGAVAVGAVDWSRDLTFYSNWGDAQDVTAPGGDTRRDANGDGYPDGVLQNTIQIQQPMEDGYLWFQGTSMASPHAAGVAALIVSEGVTNPDEVERILKETAVHPEDKDWDPRFGAGIIDARAAVERARSDYAPERAGFGLLGLLGLGGLGAGFGATRRARVAAAAVAGGTALLGAGVAGTLSLPALLAGLLGGAGSLGGVLLGFSALVPFLLVVGLLSFRRLRPVLLGLCLAVAATLAHGAVVLPTLLTGLPGGAPIDRLWLALQAGLAFALAWRLTRLRR